MTASPPSKKSHSTYTRRTTDIPPFFLYLELGQKNIDISLSGEVLTVKANRSILDFETGKHLINPGAFGEKEYVVHLPHDADLDNISATCEDGLLVVDIPLAANVLPRKIEVKSKSGENKNV